MSRIKKIGFYLGMGFAFVVTFLGAIASETIPAKMFNFFLALAAGCSIIVESSGALRDLFFGGRPLDRPIGPPAPKVDASPAVHRVNGKKVDAVDFFDDLEEAA